MYDKAKSCVKSCNEMSDFFASHIGVRQGIETNCKVEVRRTAGKLIKVKLINIKENLQINGLITNVNMQDAGFVLHAENTALIDHVLSYNP